MSRRDSDSLSEVAQPAMAGVRDPEGLSEPGSLAIRQTRQQCVEVGLISRSPTRGLEQQHYLRREDRDSQPRFDAEQVPGERDPRVPAIDPLVPPPLEEEEFDMASRWRVR